MGYKIFTYSAFASLIVLPLVYPSSFAFPSHSSSYPSPSSKYPTPSSTYPTPSSTHPTFPTPSTYPSPSSTHPTYPTPSSTYTGPLDYKFYDRSCPHLQMIVKFGVWTAFKNDTRILASLLRMHFHDCFINGCDASVLLDDTDSFTGEKNASPNRNSLRGFEVIESIKADIERACPSIVSCADILALAARESVTISGGPFWPVPLGRRDGTTASQQDANEQLPSPFESFEEVAAKFASTGLDEKDVVALSGAHTIGFAQCFTFKNRLFNFKGSGQPDPGLESSTITNLQNTCPDVAESNTNLAPLDGGTSTKFDNSFYSNLVNKNGVLHSDQALMDDEKAADLVNAYSSNPFLFATDFAAAMVKMGNVGVLTGTDGEIRNTCGSVNTN